MQAGKECDNMNLEKEIAGNLLAAKAVSLRPNQPFTWASGIKSPIYCDNRLILSYPDKRDVVVSGYITAIRKQFSEVQMLMGTATAGIPWAAMCAQEMKLPMGYVRSSNKNHGKENKIEGNCPAGTKVVIIEDLISTGGSVCDVVEALRAVGAEVLGVAAIFTYELSQATKTFTDLNCPLITLSNYSTLIEVALANQTIQDTDLEKLKAWKQDPRDEEWMKK